MTTLDVDKELEDARGIAARVTRDSIVVSFEDGRTISVPLAWYPRLAHSTAKERARFKLGAFGLHWPALDEDISYRSMLLGRKSDENPQFTRWWLEQRAKGRSPTLMQWLALRKKARAEYRSTEKMRRVV